MLLKHILRAVLVFSLCTGAALASEDNVKKALQAKYPDIRIEKITKTSYLGLYEVYANGELIYTDEKADYLFLGNIVDTKTRKNVTEERMRVLTAVSFDQLPLDLAIKTVKGNGKRKMAVFSDPDCPYCKRLEQSLTKVTDVTIYTFLYPIDALHPQARGKAKAVWCSEERVKAWDALMLKGIEPKAAPNCEAPLDKIAELGQKYRVTGTPTIIFANGRKVPGAIPAEELEKMLNAALN